MDVDGERIEVSLGPEGVVLDGEPVDALLEPVDGTPILLFRMGGRLNRVSVVRGNGRGRYAFWTDDFRFEVEALDERRRAILDLTARSSGSRGPAPLVAPMPGLVVRVAVGEGDRVVAGQALVVVEAMKMENELRATGEGVVTRVRVRAGEAVEKGTVLVELGEVPGPE